MINEAKRKAKKLLSEKECRSSKVFFAALLIFFMLSAVFTFAIRAADSLPILPSLGTSGQALRPAVKLILSVLSFFLLLMLRSSVRLGREAWFLSIAKGNKPKKTRLFFWCNPRHSAKACGVYLRLFLLKLALGAFFLFPGLTVLLSVLYTVTSQGTEYKALICLLSGASLLLIVGSVYYFVNVQRYMLTPTLIAENPRMSFAEALKMSKSIMTGNCINAAFMKISFLPWFLSCILVFPLFYVWPYYNRAMLCFKLNIKVGCESQGDVKKA